ncbi:hypothetical protein [Mycolicibacterium helvum]|uniref:hypothetical protein n=1 Tax=Mycolicibacterium helvum TaxID=1534349 RepID=UPI001FEC8CA1|nr:hypothetical protein [Mycolicibacterium helvum]
MSILRAGRSSWKFRTGSRRPWVRVGRATSWLSYEQISAHLDRAVDRIVGGHADGN